MLGRKRLQRADRLPVVPELAVVVVLDDQAVAGRAPSRRPAAGAPAASATPSGNWCAGVSSMAPALRRGCAAGQRALVIDRHRSQPHPGRRRDLPVRRMPVGLDRHRALPLGSQHVAEQLQALGEPGAHDDPLGRHADAASAGEVPGQRGAEHRQAARVAVTDSGAPARRQAPGERPPARPRAGTPTHPARRAAGHAGLRAPARSGLRLRRRAAPAPRARRPRCPNRAWPRASPRRQAGRRRRRRCCAQGRDRRQARARRAAPSRPPACRCAPPRAARTQAPLVAECRTTRGGGRDRPKWPTFPAWNWILNLILLLASLELYAEQRGGIR